MAPDGRPVCSVCIANYNGMAVIDACLASVRAQDCAFPIEIIVHDDASTDGSADYIRQRYPEVKLIASRDNVGFCVSNNRMAEAAAGDYVLLLNNDAELFPDALRRMHERARSGHTGLLGLPQFDAASGALIDRGSLLDPFLNPVPNIDPERGEVAVIIGACLWIPRRIWNDIGGFPAWFHSLGEDVYLSCVARLMGYPVGIVHESGFRHWVGQSFGGGKVRAQGLVTTLRRRALTERNKTFVMVLCVPSPWVFVLAPVHLALLTIEGVALSLVKRNPDMLRSIYLPCLTALWRNRAVLASLRSQVQRMRRVGAGRFFSVFSWTPYKLAMLLRHGWPDVR